MALQRTRRPRFRSGRSLRSRGSPLNARPLGGFRKRLAIPIWGSLFLPLFGLGAPLFPSRAEQGLIVAVVDRAGAPLPGVTLLVDPDPPSEGRRGLFRAATDLSGQAALPQLPSGTYSVKACLNGLYSDYDARVRVMQNRPAYVVLSMGIGETFDPACPRPPLASELPLSDSVPFVLPPPLPRLPAGRTFPAIR